NCNDAPRLFVACLGIFDDYGHSHGRTPPVDTGLKFFTVGFTCGDHLIKTFKRSACIFTVALESPVTRARPCRSRVVGCRDYPFLCGSSLLLKGWIVCFCIFLLIQAYPGLEVPKVSYRVVNGFKDAVAKCDNGLLVADFHVKLNGIFKPRFPARHGIPDTSSAFTIQTLFGCMVCDHCESSTHCGYKGANYGHHH